MVEFTPEWVLMNLSDGWETDGNGIASIIIDESNSSKAWVELALISLDIEWDIVMFSSNQVIETEYVFEIEDIKDSCPEFYEKLVKANNDAKANYK